MCRCCTVDEIYHLAASASPFHYMHNPIKTIKTNTVGTANMLGMCYTIIYVIYALCGSVMSMSFSVHPLMASAADKNSCFGEY